MFFASDVFHHLNKEFTEDLLQKNCSFFDYIIVKDIDCHKRFGNFMNRMHDRIINGEIIRDVDPQEYESYFSRMGYEVKLFNLRKLWYPHFLLIAQKGSGVY